MLAMAHLRTDEKYDVGFLIFTKNIIFKNIYILGHSLFACITNIIFMFLINWIYALANVGIVLILIYYIHVTAPGVAPGLAANFSFFDWIKQRSKKLFSSGGDKDQFLIIAPPQFTSR